MAADQEADSHLCARYRYAELLDYGGAPPSYSTGVRRWGRLAGRRERNRTASAAG